MDISWIHDWFMGLGTKYNVNPYIFGAIYVGAIPFFSLSLGWLIKNLKQTKSIVFPTMLTGFFFCSAYVYLIIVGENVPQWVYWFIALLLLYGSWSTWVKIKKSKESTI
jgi:hypothetical protein